MVLEDGIWDQATADDIHQGSDNLARFLIGYLPKEEPVYDFGCGNGFYLGKLEAYGFKCIGVEGFQLHNFQCSDVIIHNLIKKMTVTTKGSVISLEVGEHLPKSAQENFMQTVTENCSGKLVFSWAELNQPGVGHINCRDQKEVIADVVSRGFKYMEEITMQVRETIEENTSWFSRTLLIFERV